MLRNDRRIAIGCWLVAGLPILAAFLQAVFAILGVDALGIPVVGELKQVLDTIEVLDAAGVIFRDNGVVVFGLFILVALSWLGVGVSMLALEDRQITYAGAGLVTVFLVLFFLVYSPLLWEDVQPLQLAGFVAIPVVAVGAIWISVTSYEWTVTLEAETVELLSEAREQVETAHREFDRTVRQEVDSKTLDWLASAAPSAVAAFENTTDEFDAKCQEIQDEADRIRDGTSELTDQSRHTQATQLRDEAASLEPVERANAAIETLRTNVAQELRTEFGSLTVTSTYGDSYTIRNMSRYNELPITEMQGPPIQIGGDVHELGERLAEALGNGLPLAEVSRAVDRATGHIEEMKEEIQRHESTFDDRRTEIERALSETETALSRIDADVGERLGEMLFEKRFGDETPPFPTEIDVRNQIDEAKTELHNCRFDSALRTMDGASSDAAQIKQIAIFFTDSVVPTIEHGSGSIPIPADVDQAVIEQLQPEIQQTYNVSYTIEDDTLRIDATDGVTVESRPGDRPEKSRQSRSGSGPPPEDVLYLLRELNQVASETGTQGTATLQLAEYPDKFADSDLVEELESFCARQTQITKVETPETEPGYITVVVDDEESTRRVLTDICDRYQEQFG